VLECCCNTPSNPWHSGTYSWQLSRIIYCPHRPTRVFCVHFCRRFDPGGSLDRRVNCRRESQPRWVGARRSTKGARKRETGVKGKPAAFVLSCAQVGCACSRGLQASAWEGARGLYAPSCPLRVANPPVREPWTFIL
jgi:hypothetical protein